MQAADLLELRDDLNREPRRLNQLVDGLLELQQRLSNSGETEEAAALRLHSFYMGVEKILLLVSRVVNGGTPSQGEGWHRRLLERMAIETLSAITTKDVVELQQVRDQLKMNPEENPVEPKDLPVDQPWANTIQANSEGGLICINFRKSTHYKIQVTEH